MEIKDFAEVIYLILSVIMMSSLIGVIIDWTNQKDLERNLLADCIITTVHEQEAKVNPYSQEAWNMFASECVE